MKKMALCLSFVGAVSSINVLALCNPNIQPIKPDTIYVDNKDGTVTDKETGLMWQKCSLGQVYSAGTCSGGSRQYTWPEALKAAVTTNTNNAYGYNDWRLPNIKELSSLVETACENPAINSSVFPSTEWGEHYSYFSWSATTYNSGDGGAAWLVSNNYGSVNYEAKKLWTGKVVRLVRNKQD